MITTAWVGGGCQEGRADWRAKRTLGHGSDLLAFYSQKGKKASRWSKTIYPYSYYCMHALFFSFQLLALFFKSRSDYWVLVDYILSSLELTLFFLSIVTTDHLDILVLENRDSLSNAYIIFLLYIEANHFPPLLPAF